MKNRRVLNRNVQPKDFNQKYFTWRIGAYQRKTEKTNIIDKENIIDEANIFDELNPKDKEVAQGFGQDIFQQPIARSFDIVPYKLDTSWNAAAHCWFRDLVPSFYTNLRPRKYGTDDYYLHEIIPFTTYNEVPFLTAMLIATMCQDLIKFGRPTLSTSGRELLQKLLRSLRQTLFEGRVSMDELVCAIGGLASVTELLGQFEQAAVHAKGLKDALAAHGGNKALSLSDLFSPVSTAYFEHAKTMVIIRARIKIDPDCFGRHEYPTHPFSPDLCLRLTHLPPGFSDIALKTTLSERIIHILERISRWDKSRPIFYPTAMNDKRNRLNGCLCAWHLKHPGLSLNERILLLGSLAYCIFMTGEPKLWFNLRCFIQLLCQALGTADLNNCDAGLMTWTAIMLKAGLGTGNLSYKFANRLLDSARPSWPNPNRVPQGVLRSFFWNVSLSAALRANVGNESFGLDYEIEETELTELIGLEGS